jgi:hypothetical protein
VLAQMVVDGRLTEADEYEVQGVVALLLERLRAGEITLHFMDLVLRKLAEEKYADWRARAGFGE